ncbi:hypothetical protein K8Z61_14760 [Nocardioides sp. TRM66260-LWL]|uniref:hypothetical protein n=1 Tax=Nocardioides sp. TRM66260-LWL TaxID=2874478 RepID=UPI001CC34E60|nr:hypothetical protein [Nocardioides sp. TRM66260-LWL]MBZ5735752.1 hypothetical protein [Nocardioides sp. TRM66260-LWL]
MRILRALGIALVVLAALVALTPVVALAQRAHARESVAADVRRQVAAAVPAARLAVASDAPGPEAAAERRWGRPRWVFEDLVCRLDAVDGAYGRHDGVQGCQVRRLALFAVPRIPADAWPSADPLGCRVVPLAGTPALAGAADVLEAGGTLCPGSITVPDPDAAAVLLAGRRPSSLTGSPAWVVVATIRPLAEIRLPCLPWSFLDCAAPLRRPVLPET